MHAAEDVHLTRTIATGPPRRRHKATPRAPQLLPVSDYRASAVACALPNGLRQRLPTAACVTSNRRSRGARGQGLRSRAVLTDDQQRRADVYRKQDRVRRAPPAHRPRRHRPGRRRGRAGAWAIEGDCRARCAVAVSRWYEGFIYRHCTLTIILNPRSPRPARRRPRRTPTARTGLPRPDRSPARMRLRRRRPPSCTR